MLHQQHRVRADALVELSDSNERDLGRVLLLDGREEAGQGRGGEGGTVEPEHEIEVERAGEAGGRGSAEVGQEVLPVQARFFVDFDRRVARSG